MMLNNRRTSLRAIPLCQKYPATSRQAHRHSSAVMWRSSHAKANMPNAHDALERQQATPSINAWLTTELKWHIEQSLTVS